MSSLSEWVNAQKKGTVLFGSWERAKTSVTCRIDDLHLQMLERLAKELGLTRTACAEHILELAIGDAWTACYGRPLNPEEVRQMTDLARRVGQAQALAVQQLNGNEQARRLMEEAHVIEVRMMGDLHSIRLSVGSSNMNPATAPIIASFHVSWLEDKDVTAIAKELQDKLLTEIAEGRLSVQQ